MGSKQVGELLSQVSMDDRRVSSLRSLKICARRALYAGLLIVAVLMNAAAKSSAAEDLGDIGSSATEDATLDDAQRARAEGDTVTAIAILYRLLTDNPDNVDALVQLGFAQLALEDTNSAEQVFSKTLRLATDYVDAMLGLAYVAFRWSDFEQAEQFAVSVLEAAPDYVGAWNVLDAAKGAQEEALAVNASLPPPRPIEIPPAEGTMVDPEIIAPVLKVALPLPVRRRAFLSIGTAFKAVGDVIYGLEFGLGQKANNLARAIIGGSVEFPVTENVAFYSRVRIEKSARSRGVSLASRLSKRASGGSFSLGLGSSAASSVGGLATVVDARVELPVSDSATLGLGVAKGQELDGPGVRDLRSVAIALAAEINDDLTIIGTVTSEPGNRHINLTLARRF